MTDRATVLTETMALLAQASEKLERAGADDSLLRELRAETWELWRKMESYRYGELNKREGR